MTNEELIEKVASAINNVEAKYMSPTKQHYKYADAAIDTIFAALKEPTEKMESAAIDAGDDDCLWQAMLSASPLAPKEKLND